MGTDTAILVLISELQAQIISLRNQNAQLEEELRRLSDSAEAKFDKEEST